MAMMTFPILTSLVALPIVGALVLLFMKSDEHEDTAVRSVALVVSVLVFAETLLLWSRFNLLLAGVACAVASLAGSTCSCPSQNHRWGHSAKGPRPAGTRPGMRAASSSQAERIRSRTTHSTCACSTRSDLK